MLGYRMSLRKAESLFLKSPDTCNSFIKSNPWSVMLFCPYMYFFFPKTEEAWKIVIVLLILNYMYFVYKT